ncbi:MAG: protease modulator HflC [Thermodesulfobacteriota bacterium]|nr:protease modulator HflC [Thermodesulfobacteriota bacterium]
MKIKGLIYGLLIIIIIFLFGSIYIVDETEQVVVTQFGRATGEPKTEPGMYFKLPFIQNTNYFPKNLLDWDGDPGQIPTLDKTFIWVDTFSRWKIVDPLKFFETVNNVYGALGRLDDILDPAVRNFVTSYPLIETVRMTNRELDTFEVGVDETRKKSTLGEIKTGRDKITKGIIKKAQPKLSQFGIELVDVKIKRLNYVEEVQKSVYSRMIAERKQIAEKFRAEGKGEARKIEGDIEREMKRITSKAYKTAQEIKGKAEAEATKIYALAYGKNPDFYTFINTLDIYKTTLDKDTTLVLSTDSEFFKYLKDYSGLEK